MQRGTTYTHISRRWRRGDGTACGLPITSCLQARPPIYGPQKNTSRVSTALPLIAVAAGMTQKLTLGGLVMGNTYRNPALVAKMATTLDQASKGRFILGLGAAWFKREHEAYGWDFPSLRERSDRLQEACELIRKLFTAAGPVDYDGRYYRLDQAPLSPGCYQKPHIPIMVGGHGERRTLRTLAMHGDIFNFNGWGARGLSHGMSVESLSAQARRVGKALRKGRSRSGGDQKHDAHAVEPHGRRGICQALHRNPRPRDHGRAARLHRRSNRRVRRRRCRGDHIRPAPRRRNRAARRRGDRRGLRLAAEPRIPIFAWLGRSP